MTDLHGMETLQFVIHRARPGGIQTTDRRLTSNCLVQTILPISQDIVHQLFEDTPAVLLVWRERLCGLWVMQCDVCAAMKKPNRTPRAPLGRNVSRCAIR